MRAAAREWSHLHPDVRVEWHDRSGLSFAEQPLEELTPFYDVISIDHPFVAAASAAGSLVPLDEVLARADIDSFAADAIGKSHRSYECDGHTWALATDAACQVSIVRPDLLADLPATWDDVLELGRSAPGRVTASFEPHAVMCSFLSLCASFGEPVPATTDRFADPVIGRMALDWLLSFASVCHAGAWEDFVPERMSTSDDCLYCPLQFGYITYSRHDFDGTRLRFVDIPSATGRDSAGSCLGGAGLAVSAASAHIIEAAAFAAWVVNPMTQAQVILSNHGQPGSRGVWFDTAADEVAGGFFSGTRATIEAAVIRPSAPWWPRFQRDAGQVLSEALRAQRDPDVVLAEFEQLWSTAVDDALSAKRSRR
jgi:multiple sugar transport system substrate-binding protein